MAIESDLNIFISWSGDLAKNITRVLHQWLPTMFDHVRPWFSDTDIDAGSRGLTAIQERLDISSFGIIVVTPENMNKPWLLFEAGALSRRLEGDLTKVVPLLVGFDDVSQLTGSPLFQFQGVKLDEPGARSLCLSIARTIKLSESTITTRFNRAWADLETGVAAAIEASGEQPDPPDVKDADLLKSMFQSIKTLERQVSRLSVVSSGVFSPLTTANFDRAVETATSDTLSRWLTKSARRIGSESTNPWTDGAAMQALQDRIQKIAATFKPVRWVSPIERDGSRFIGVMFEDGEGLSEGDLNWFMEQMLSMPVTVIIETDAPKAD